MPSFINHNRNYTWPPSMHLVDPSLVSPEDKQSVNELPDIDEDPFSHFISPVTEEDDPYEEYDFNAGIMISEPSPTKAKSTKFRSAVAKKWAHYVANHHSYIHGIYHGTGSTSFVDMPTIEEPGQENLPELAEDFARIETAYKLEVRAPREPTRGRAQDLLNPVSRRKRGRRYSRTLSGRRHSWREPSPDLFTVMEESNETDEGESRRSERSSAVIERSRL